MKTRTLLLIILAFVLSSLDCRKNKPLPSNVLPEATHEGKNTFGCKVDGKIWIPFSKCTWTNTCREFLVHIGVNDSVQLPLPVRMSFHRNRDGYVTSFNFATQWNQPGISTVGIKTADSLKISYDTPWGSEYTLHDWRPSGFRFEITHLDTAKRIIAGTFEGTLYNTDDSVKITEGRFDFQFSFCRCSD